MLIRTMRKLGPLSMVLRMPVQPALALALVQVLVLPQLQALPAAASLLKLLLTLCQPAALVVPRRRRIATAGTTTMRAAQARLLRPPPCFLACPFTSVRLLARIGPQLQALAVQESLQQLPAAGAGLQRGAQVLVRVPAPLALAAVNIAQARRPPLQLQRARTPRLSIRTAKALWLGAVTVTAAAMTTIPLLRFPLTQPFSMLRRRRCVEHACPAGASWSSASATALPSQR